MELFEGIRRIYSMEKDRRCACGSERIVPWREMADVTEKLNPGGEVPRGECELCGAFLYLEAEDLELKPSDEMVRDGRRPYAVNPRALSGSRRATRPWIEGWVCT